jgi:DnaJ-class molecular chaperone
MALKRCSTCNGSGKVKRFVQGEYGSVLKAFPCAGACNGQGWITVPDNA